MNDLRIDVRGTARELIAEVRADVKQAGRAQVMAINRTAEQLRTQAGREVRQVYNVKLAAIRKATKLLKARRESLRPSAEVSFSGRRIPLIEFAARPVNPWNVAGRKHRRGGGVSVQVLVKGGRKVVEGAFITALTANNYQGGGAAGIRAVFRRTGRERYPIRNLRSVSIPVMVAREAIAKVLLRFADERFEVNLEQALRYLTGR